MKQSPAEVVSTALTWGGATSKASWGVTAKAPLAPKDTSTVPTPWASSRRAAVSHCSTVAVGSPVSRASSVSLGLR